MDARLPPLVQPPPPAPRVEPAPAGVDVWRVVPVPLPRADQRQTLRVTLGHAFPHESGYTSVRETTRILSRENGAHVDVVIEHTFPAEGGLPENALRMVSSRIRAADVLDPLVLPDAPLMADTERPLVSLPVRQALASASLARSRTERAARAALLEGLDTLLHQWRLQGDESTNCTSFTRLLAFRATVARRGTVSMQLLQQAEVFTAALARDHRETMRRYNELQTEAPTVVE